jgi:alpha-D-xyloside xylohydrolase
MYHRPPEKSVLITPRHFKTSDGRQGLDATYYKDAQFGKSSLERVDSTIDVLWYTGRPDYVTDSTLSIRWKGALVPSQTGRHQFHIKCFGPRRIFLDGRELPFVYRSVEAYTDFVDLQAGTEYRFVVEAENTSTGALKVILNWKTPEILARESVVEKKERTRNVYLPANNQWYDFWTGRRFQGGQTVTLDAPIDKIPLLIRAGSILPMGPFVQYATEKPADPIELRIYPGADGDFVLYEDENENYDYEGGIFSTIALRWDDSKGRLTLGKRQGSFPGMLEERTFQIVIVKQDQGTGIESTEKPGRVIHYQGEEQVVQF